MIKTTKNKMSPIYKALRAEAKRSCACFASDIEYDITAIKECIKTGKYAGVPRNKFPIGFRDCGVDSSGFIHMRGKDYPYNACFVLEINKDGSVELNKVSKTELVALADKLEEPYDRWIEYKDRWRADNLWNGCADDYEDYATWYGKQEVLV